DIDAALAFGKALLAGSHVERPHDMTISADIGRATIAGFEARDASARLKVDADGLQIDRLSVADLGGAAFSASGRIVIAPPSPQGSIRVDLNAPDMTPVIALLARFAPQAAQVLQRDAPAMAPAKLHATLTVAGASPAEKTTLAVDGSLGKARIALNGETTTDLNSFKTGDMHLTGKLTAADGKVLVAMLGLNRVLAVDTSAGTLTLAASGPLRGTWHVDGKLAAGGLDASASGTTLPFADRPTADLHATVLRADAAPLRTSGHGELPVGFSGRVVLAGKNVSMSDIDATVADAKLRGKLALTLVQPHRLRGEIEADRVNGAALIAAAIGMPVPPASKTVAWSWSEKPFGAGLFGDYTGQIKINTRRIDLLPHLTAREFSATLALGKDAVAVDDMSGDVAGGHLSGRLSFRTVNDGLNAHAKLTLSGADAAGLLAAGARPAVTGTLVLAGDVEGSGLSPVALIGSLHGSGKIALTDAQFAGLDPRAFDAVTHAVDQGLAIDSARIADVVGKALESGRLSVKRADGTIAVSAGQARLSKFSADSTDAQLSLAGNLDLTDGSIVGRLVLSGSSEQAGARPDIFMALSGPVSHPSRSIDVSALTGWLTLRAVENQAKQLREMERKAFQSQASPPNPAPAPPSNNQATPNNAPAATSSAPPPRGQLVMPEKPSPVPVPMHERAPPLPAPVEIGPLPAPSVAAKPEVSAGVPQH
ncbi:MAG: AsmA-like C-terminal region-containing protein, partial [Stellaceae bacterium]